MATLNVAKITELQGHKDCIYALSAGREAHEFYTGAGDGWVVYWNLESSDQGQLIATFPTSIFALRYFPGRHLLLVGLSRGGYYFLDLNSKVPHANFQKNHGIYDFKQIPGTSRIIVAGEKGYIHVVDSENFEELYSFQPATANARKINVAPDGKKVAIGFSDEYVRIFDASTFELLSDFQGHEHSVFAVAWTPDQRYLLTGGRDAQLKVWDIKAHFALYMKIPAHLFTINDIVMSPEQQWFATASRDKTVKIWDLQTFELKKVIDLEKLAGHRHSINEMLWSTYFNYLITTGDDKTVKVWAIDEPVLAS